MTTIAGDAESIAMARGRGWLYALLANAWHYPDQGALSAMSDAADRLVRSGAVHHLSDATAGALGAVVAALEAIGLGERLLPEHIRDRYIGLFGHVVRGTCPPYELEYGQNEIIQQANELADIAGFYNAFGLESAGAGADRPDHLATECEFLGVLCAKEAVGRKAHLPALVETCVEAQQAFLKDHLGRWLPAFCARVMAADGDGLYGRLARLASSVIEAECQRFEITAGPQYLTLRTVDPDADGNINCDGSTGEDRLVPLTISGSGMEGAR